MTTRISAITLLACLCIAFAAPRLLAVPPWKLMVEKTVADANQYLSVASRPVTTSTTATGLATDQSFVLARRAWATERLQIAQQVATSLEGLPAPTAPIDFFMALETMKERKEQRDKEAAIAIEVAELAEKDGRPGAEAIARDKAAFYTHLAEVMTTVRKEMTHAFETAYPDETERKKVRTQAFTALSKRKAEEKEAARQRAAEAQVAAERKKREAEDLAERARAELARATSADGKDLAVLRLDYANLSATVEEYRAKVLETEVTVRDAEERFQRTRATLNEQVPAVLALEAGASQVQQKRDEWTKESEQLVKSAAVLEKECAVLRERIDQLRRVRDTHREKYDKLHNELDKNQKRRVYRQRVYFARQVYRLAAAQLDLYRTRIEWLEHKRKLLLRSRESYLWAVSEIAAHVEVRYSGQTPQQWLLFVVGLLATYAFAWLLRALFNFVFRRFAAQSRWQWDNIVMEELGLPIRIIAILAGLWFSLNLLSLSDRAWVIARAARYSLEVLWFGLLAWRIVNIVSRILEPKFEATETTLDDQLLRFVRRGLRLIIVVITVIYLLENLGWKVSSLLAGLGIGGLAFALAAKDTLANLFGSIVLFMDRPFHIGNWVKIAGAEGIVEDIGIRSTRIRTFKDTVVTIPNATVANSSAENIHSFRKRRLYFTLTLRLDTSVAKVQETVDGMRDILTDHPMILDGFYVYVTGIPANGIEIMIYCFVATRDWGEWLHHSQTIYMTTLQMLENIGVGLAFDTTTIELENKRPLEIAGLADMLGGRK